MSTFKFLFTPKKIGDTWLKNRILSTGHMTTYVKDGLPTEQLINYHKERAKGGVGLIVVEANAVHRSASMTSGIIAAYQDDIIPYYKKLAEAVHPYGTKMFVQLFHPGREISPSGPAIPLAPSSVPSERFRVMPKELEIEEIQDIIKGYGETAERVKKGGLDGVEIVSSHGYLISQFWSPRINLRNDQYGGSFENRMRFLKEIVESVRAKVGPHYPVGLRLSVDDFVKEGNTFEEVLEILKYIDQQIGGLNYFSLVAGGSATYASSIFIVPPAPIPPAVLSSYGGKVREVVSVPIFLTSRINDPVIGEKVLASGQADIVGMTRALICDPHMPNKALREEFDRIRVCIACNQACIGHMQKDEPISCIQNPVTGRETMFSELPKIRRIKHIVIVGGGPAGMKASVILAERGHKVTLVEKSNELGGQVKLARKIPGREEFGELIPNLKREMDHFGVKVILNTNATKELILSLEPDEVILATGATPYLPDVEGINLQHVHTTWDILNGKKITGNNVVVADWNGDMPGVGTALYLANQGYNVEILTTCAHIGFGLQSYVRDVMLTQLYTKEVEMKSHYKIFQIEQGKVTFENIYTGQMLVRENIDSVVIAYGNIQETDLYNQLKGSMIPIHRIGDCMSPKTVEEAVLSGFELAVTL